MKFAIAEAAPAPTKVETESHAQCLLHVWRTGWPVLSARTMAMSALLAANCGSPSAPTAAAVEQAMTDALKSIVSGFFFLLMRRPELMPSAAASSIAAGPP